MAKKAQGAFRTISEVADWLDIPAHVLRFWESKFSQIKPVKRAGGRRYYRPEDMRLIGGIKKLLHDDGLTIRGVQKMMKEDGIKAVSAHSPDLDMPTDEEAARRRTARRARRKARAEQAKAAKPPLTPETIESIPAPTPEADPEPETSELEQDSAADNVVQLPKREVEEAVEPEAVSEPDVVEEEPAVEETPEDASVEEAAQAAKEPDEPDEEAEAAEEPAAEDEPQSEPELSFTDLPEPTVEAAEPEDTAPAEPVPPPTDIPDDPDPAAIDVSEQAKTAELALRTLRRSEGELITDKAAFRALHDRLTDLRGRMGDG